MLVLPLLAELAFDAQFRAAAQGALALVAGAAADRLVHHQLVLGGDLEDSGAGTRVSPNPAHAHFIRVLSDGFRPKLNPPMLPGAYASSACWRLELFAGTDAAVQVGREGRKHHAHGRCVL